MTVRITDEQARQFRRSLRRWFKRNSRDLPWRRTRDAYEVLVSELMLQQTQVSRVLDYYDRFLERFPSLAELARARPRQVREAWDGLGYYARARNLYACAKAVAEQHGGVFPDTEAGLLELPGVGPYTAAAIAAIAFDRHASPVDGNIERVISRLHAIEDELPGAKPRIRQFAAQLTPPTRAGDFAQAMMDLGATICTPKSPACVLCPWNEPCIARAHGTQETFPRKAAKKTGALRRGVAFVALRQDGAILLRTRPEKGLLGGMTEVPTSQWSADFKAAGAVDHAPLRAQWRRVPGVVTHVFTHFPLELLVYVADVGRSAQPVGGRWVGRDELDRVALPNVMKKVIAHAVAHRRGRSASTG
jgi:A/G-specific adenine glycosylase